MTPDKALQILKKYTTKPNLIKHALAVSAIMGHFAKLSGEDQDYWATVGMLHDIDFECCPEEHCCKCVEILKAEGFDEKAILSIQSHGYPTCTQIEPKMYMEKVLSATDQLSGLIIAVALMRPDKKIASVTLDSVMRKWKDKKFAAGADREQILSYCKKMDKSLDYVIEQSLIALQNIASKLDL